MTDPVCRVAVQHGSRTVDLALPTAAPIGVLLPSIVDLVAVDADEERRWYLSSIAHGCLDESMTLRDNDVRDGDLLLLTTAAMPTPIPVAGDPWRTVIDAAEDEEQSTRTSAPCLTATALLAAAALGWSGIVTHSVSHLATAGAAAILASVGAVAARHAHPSLSVTLSVIGVVFAFVAGLLAVPGGPSTANSLLAAAMACASSALLLRIIRRGTVCLTALAATSALTATAAAGGVAWSLPVTATGVAMAGLSLAAVGVAPRMSIAATGLTPPLSAEQPLDDETTRALAAHQILTGLVVGSAGATALGAAVVVGGCVHDNIAWPKGALFAAVVGLAMVLRSRTHVDRRRREALAICGMAALAASGARVVVSAPGQANWICLVATALCVGALSGAFAPATNPLARRAVDVLEYLALAAVVPLACWIGGLYGAVRGVSLP